MIYDMLSFLELHIIDLAGSLSPFKSVLVRELHAFGHFLIAILRQGISNNSGIIADSNKALKLRLFLCNYSGRRASFNAALIFTIDILVIDHRSIHIVLIIDFIGTENGLLVWYPEYLPVAPFVNLAERAASSL
jgi:hypothetical protein